MPSSSPIFSHACPLAAAERGSDGASAPAGDGKTEPTAKRAKAHAARTSFLLSSLCLCNEHLLARGRVQLLTIVQLHPGPLRSSRASERTCSHRGPGGARTEERRGLRGGIDI